MSSIKFLVSLIIDNIDDLGIIKNRITQLSEKNFDGFVLAFDERIPASEYLSDKYLAAVSEIIIFAKSLSLLVWLKNDDNSIASPSDLPLVNQRLLYNNGEVLKIFDKDKISPFYEVCAYDHIENTYERIRSGLSSEAFEYITGFCGCYDGFGGGDPNTVPWYDGILEEFLNDYGMDINPFLAELFEYNGEASRFRARYWRRITKKLSEAYIAPISAWCKQNEKKYFLVSKSGQTPISQVSGFGSYFEADRSALISSVSIDSPEDINSFYACTASSLARQYGSGEAVASVFGNTGWELTPEDFESSIKQLIKCGITTFVLNSCFTCLNYNTLSRYRISFPVHIPWDSALPDIFRSLKSFAAALKKRPNKILLVCPTKTIWSHYTPCGDNKKAVKLSDTAVNICKRLYEMDRSFDITDEIILENEAVFGDEGIIIGEASYTSLLTAPECIFSKKGNLALEKAKANGVRIINDIPISDTEIIPLELIRNELKEVVPIAVTQDNWTVTLPIANILPLTPKCTDRCTECEFTVAESLDTQITLLVTDTYGAVSINNILVECEAHDERGRHYNITDNVVSGTNKIVIDGCSETFAYLIGNFKVIPDSGYRSLDEYYVQTRGDFKLYPAGAGSDTNLIRCGYPFSNSCASAKKIIYIEENINHPIIKLDCSGVSIMEVFFDSQSIGFVYGSQNTIELPPMAADEKHVLKLKCYPSAYNLYGDTGIMQCGSSVKLFNWKIPMDIELIQEF